MSGLEDLYREIILDHYRTPRNRGQLEVPPAHKVEGFNPLCGDEITVYVDTDGEKVTDVRIDGQGCSISQASASMMTNAIKGRTFTEISELTRAFKSMMSIHENEIGGEGEPGTDSTGDAPAAPDGVRLGDLEALRGVVKFPVRIKCATLAWNTLAQAIDEARSVGGASPGSS